MKKYKVKRKKNNKKVFLILVIFIVCFSIGFSYLSSTLGLYGNVIVKGIGLMMPRSEVAFWQYSDKVEHIIFNNKIDESNIEIAYSCGTNSDELCKWDVSDKQNETVMAYLVENENDLYDLYIMANGTVYSPINSSSLIKNFTALKDITNIDVLDTHFTTNMTSMFEGNSSLTELDVTNFDTSKVTDMTAMFYGCSSLIELDVSNFDTGNVKYMKNMFRGCSSLKEIDVTSWNTKNCTTMYSLFRDCSSLTSIDVSNFDTSNVNTMYYMFANCIGLTTIDVSGFKTSKVTDMQYMFSGNTNLTSIIFSENFDTGRVTNMSNMFSHCEKMQEIDLSVFETDSLVNMSGMFQFCFSLKNVEFPESFKTHKVTSISWLFHYCRSLENIIFTESFDTSKVENFKFAFSYCYALKEINFPNSFNTSSATGMGYMFSNCTNLKSIDVTKFDTSKVTEMHFMFSNCLNLKKLNLISFDTSNIERKYKMFSDCIRLEEIILSDKFHFIGEVDCVIEEVETRADDYLPIIKTSYVSGANGKWYDVDTKVGYSPDNIPSGVAATYTSIVPADRVRDTMLITGKEFNKTIPVNATTIRFLNTAPPSGVTTKDVSADQDGGVVSWLSGTTYNVAPYSDGKTIYANPNSSYMFFSDTRINISGFNSTDALLNYIYFDNFDTSKVIYMDYMFAYTGDQGTGIEISGLEKFDTSNVISMDYMFRYYNATATDVKIEGLENWDVSKVTSMYYMFESCGYKATTFTISDISVWDVSSVSSFSYMFRSMAPRANYILDLTLWKEKVLSSVNYYDFNDSVESKVISPWV